MKQVDPHFLAVYMASSAACEITEVLPDSDMAIELNALLFAQRDILSHIFDGKHYGTDRINDFIAHSQDIKREVLRIKEEN